METHKTIDVSLNEAKKWYKSGNKTLIELALKVFNEKELKTIHFNEITTFLDAVIAIGMSTQLAYKIIEEIYQASKASAAMFKLNIVRKALNSGQDLHLTKDPKNSHIYYPYVPFVTNTSNYYKDELNSGKMEIIGTIKCEGEKYNILGGHAFGCDYAFGDPIVGLGYFYHDGEVGGANASVGYLGCANEDIAKHFSKYFGMLITEAKFGDLPDFEITKDKYGNS